MSLTELDSTVAEADPISENIFKRTLKVSFDWEALCSLGLTILTNRISSVLASLTQHDA